MLEAMWAGLLHFTPTTIVWVVVGVVLTTIIAIIPGLGGLFALAMLLPLIHALPQDAALAMLMASVAVSGTGNTITGVLFGVPGSASGVGVIFDGYPMAKRGEGIRAVTAGLTASAVGGLIGAVVLVAIIPVMRPLVLAFSSPEFFMMVLLALIFMAYVGEGSMLKSLITGFMGLMLSFVGLEFSTGTTRYVFGQLYLWAGISLVPMMIGLFAIAEMMQLLRSGRSIAQAKPQSSTVSQIVVGMKDVFVHWRITLQSSLTGAAVGFAPGIGAVAAQFLAYAQAMKTSVNGKYYGTGVVEGVIAADASTNSKDGSQLVPTLAFGIPGSAPMAILIAAMIAVGIQPGPQMVTEHMDIVWMFIWILLFANILGAALCIGATGLMARVVHLRPSLLVAPVLLVALFGAYASDNHLGAVWTALFFGLVGYVMMRFKYSRATFTIGFVLGIILERHYLLSMRVHGWAFMLRPVPMALLVLGALVLCLPWIRRVARRRPGAATTGEGAGR